MEGQLGERLAYPPRGGAVSGQVGSPGSVLLEREDDAVGLSPAEREQADGKQEDGGGNGPVRPARPFEYEAGGGLVDELVAEGIQPRPSLSSKSARVFSGGAGTVTRRVKGNLPGGPTLTLSPGSG